MQPSVHPVGVFFKGGFADFSGEQPGGILEWDVEH